MTGVWGFILIANDEVYEQITAHYAADVEEQGHVKPHHGLLYYFEQYGFSKDQVVDIFERPADEAIDQICSGK